MKMHAAHLANRMALASKLADETIRWIAEGKAVPNAADLECLRDAASDVQFWRYIYEGVGSSSEPSEATVSATLALVFERVAA
jgi:hypothetical protein